MKLKRHLRMARSERGSIEGLPLQLLIMIVIAAVGLGILLAWLNSVDDNPQIGRVYGMYGQSVIQAIQVEGVDYHNIEGTYDMTSFSVKVYDTEDNPLRGATVVIRGAGASGNQITNEDGEAKFSESIMVTLPPGTQAGQIFCSATKPNYGDGSVAIPVVRGDSGMMIYVE